MARHSSKNQIALVKASAGLGLLLVAAASVFYLVGRSEKAGFQIPETKPEEVQAQAKKARHTYAVENHGSLSGDRMREDVKSDGQDPDVEDLASPETRRAMNLVDMGNWQEAERVLQAEIARDPQNVQALLELAMIQIIDKQDPQASLPLLEKALQLDPHNDSVVAELLNVYEQNQNWTQALNFFNSVNPKDGGEAETYLAYGKGMALLNMGRSQEAIETLQRAVYDGGYKAFSARESLATAYESSGQIDQAIAEYDQIANGNYKKEQVRVARIRMANAYISKGESEQARSILEAMLNQNPKDKWVSKIIQDLDSQGM